MVKNLKKILPILKSSLINSQDKNQLDLWLSLPILVVLGIIPLIPASFSQGYEQIKVLFFLGLMTVISGLWIAASFRTPGRFRIKNTPLQLSLLAFLVILILTSILGINFNSSLLGDPPYYQGIIVYLYCYLLFLIVTTIPLKIKAIYWTFMLSSLVVSIFSIVQWISLHMLNLNIPTYAGRVVSTFGQPSLYSGYLLFSLPIIIFLFHETFSNTKRFLAIVFITNIIGILASESRGAILLSLVMIFWWVFSSVKSRVIKIFLVGSVVVLLGLGIVSTFKGDGLINQEVIKPLTGTRVGEEGQERRVYIWLFITDLIAKKPLFGYGLDNIGDVFPTALQEQNPKPPFYFTVKDLTVDRSHNYLLDLLMAGGIVLFISWLIFYIGLIRQSRSHWERLFLITFFIYLLFQIQGIVQLIFFFTIAGLINRYHKNITQQ